MDNSHISVIAGYDRTIQADTYVSPFSHAIGQALTAYVLVTPVAMVIVSGWVKLRSRDGGRTAAARAAGGAHR